MSEKLLCRRGTLMAALSNAPIVYYSVEQGCGPINDHRTHNSFISKLPLLSETPSF